jgi:hypothetical protein
MPNANGWVLDDDRAPKDEAQPPSILMFGPMSQCAEDRLASLCGEWSMWPLDTVFDPDDNFGGWARDGVEDFLDFLLNNTQINMRVAFEGCRDRLILADGGSHNIAEFRLGQLDHITLHCIAPTAHCATMTFFRLLRIGCLGGDAAGPYEPVTLPAPYDWVADHVEGMREKFEHLALDKMEVRRLLARLSRERAMLGADSKDDCQMVTLDQIAALSPITSTSMRRYVSDGRLPRPDGRGRRGVAIWFYPGRIRAKLQEHFCDIEWPERLPPVQPSKRKDRNGDT